MGPRHVRAGLGIGYMPEDRGLVPQQRTRAYRPGDDVDLLGELLPLRAEAAQDLVVERGLGRYARLRREAERAADQPEQRTFGEHEAQPRAQALTSRPVW